VTIPSRGTATSTVTVNEDLSITRVTVRVDVTFPRDGQISLTLVAPDGTQVPLSQYRGGTGANYSGTVFDDQAAQPIAAGQAPFTGTFRPETPLSALDGHGSRGTWKLVVQNRATGFTGRITGWELTVTGRAPESAAAGSGAAAQLQILQTASLLLAVGDTPAGTPPGRNPVPFPVNVPVNRPLMLSLALLVNGAA
jgi:subtilisin-like proprotein convertase family protein